MTQEQLERANSAEVVRAITEWRDREIEKVIHMKPTHSEIAHRFTYHAPKPGQPEKYETIRTEAREFAELITTLCPDSRSLSLALTKIEEAVFHANAAIARDES